MAADGSWIDKWKKSGFCMLQKKERRFFMKKKILMVILAGVLVGSMESAMV